MFSVYRQAVFWLTLWAADEDRFYTQTKIGTLGEVTMSTPTTAFGRETARDDARDGTRATPAYRGYVLGLLVVVGVVAWVDRNVLAMLLESIKTEFALSDLQLGLLGGVAFGLFYATLGLPVAWLADRYNRSSVLTAAIAIWSAMTVLCGYAVGFVSLFLARVGVGIGEAGAAPPSQALVADYFPRERRGFALGILYLYIPLGFLVGFLSGGWLNQLFGWRTAFLVVGLPGLLIALLLKLTLREPPRRRPAFGRAAATPSLASTAAHFWRHSALRHLPLAGALHGIGAFAAAVWLPSYLIRVHSMTSGEAGTWMALAYGLGGGAGVLLGGWLADRAAKRTGDERWYAWCGAAALLITVPFAVVTYLSSSAGLAIASMMVATTFGHVHLGPLVAMIQNLAGPERRAVAAALYLFLVNLVSTGLGPVLVGGASDFFGNIWGDDALRYALLVVVSLTTLWAALHFALAARTLRTDLARVRAAAA
jgi:MFS family permease